MKFEEWLKNTWNPEHFNLENEIDKDLIIARFANYRKGLKRFVLDHFPESEPKYVISLSLEGFRELDETDKTRGAEVWPSFEPINDWLRENAVGTYYSYSSSEYIFDNEADAMAFRLRWGQ